MKLTKTILQLTLHSTKGHLGYKLCNNMCYNVGIRDFPTVLSHDQKPYMQAACTYASINAEVYRLLLLRNIDF